MSPKIEENTDIQNNISTTPSPNKNSDKLNRPSKQITSSPPLKPSVTALKPQQSSPPKDKYKQMHVDTFLKKSPTLKKGIEPNKTTPIIDKGQKEAIENKFNQNKGYLTAFESFIQKDATTSVISDVRNTNVMQKQSDNKDTNLDNKEGSKGYKLIASTLHPKNVIREEKKRLIEEEKKRVKAENEEKRRKEAEKRKIEEQKRLQQQEMVRKAEEKRKQQKIQAEKEAAENRRREALAAEQRKREEELQQRKEAEQKAAKEAEEKRKREKFERRRQEKEEKVRKEIEENERLKREKEKLKVMISLFFYIYISISTFPTYKLNYRLHYNKYSY